MGRLIYENGWIEYFRIGPNREPFYPFTISLSMRLADIFGISYYGIQQTIQILFLFASQIFLLILFSKLKVRASIQAIIVLYMGFSPALLNAALSLCSEIVCLPFVLMIVLFSVYSRQVLSEGRYGKIALMAVLTALAFAFSSFCKGIFQYIFLFYLIMYGLAFVTLAVKKNIKMLGRVAVYMGVLFIVFQACIGGYKLQNEKYNGHYEFTDRYDWALFGITYKRANPLTSRILLSHVASIPGWGVYRMFFTEEECRYCEFYSIDEYAYVLLPKILEGIPEEEREGASLRLAFENVMKNPFKQMLFMAIEAPKMLFMAIEAPKMFFWESTQIGFVKYPDWLSRIYVFKPVRFGLRLGAAMVTIFSFFYVLCFILKETKKLMSFDRKDKVIYIRLFSMFIICIFAGLYSLYFILTRYAFPIAPLFLLCIGDAWQNMTNRICGRNR